MKDCEEFRRALGCLRDGEGSGPEGAEIRAHVASCPECGADERILEAVGLRIRERGGAAEAPIPEGLRDAVLARLRAGEGVILDLRPFLRRVATAAAAVFVCATATAFWQASRHSDRGPAEAGATREEIVAEIVRLQMGPGR